MGSYPINCSIKDFQIILEYSKGDYLANQPPGYAVPIIGVVDKAFAIDPPINNLCRIEANHRKVDQKRFLFFMKL